MAVEEEEEARGADLGNCLHVNNMSFNPSAKLVFFIMRSTSSAQKRAMLLFFIFSIQLHHLSLRALYLSREYFIINLVFFNGKQNSWH